MKARKPTTTGPGDDEVRLLLDRYKCPIPFHEVRTRFLGNIASPVMSASPIETVKGLWGGELPPLDDINAANELIGALVMAMHHSGCCVLTCPRHRRASIVLL